jgi:hypothetical protein
MIFNQVKHQDYTPYSPYTDETWKETMIEAVLGITAMGAGAVSTKHKP